MSSAFLLPKQFNCWVVTDGKTGTENQCLGLAAALGVTPTIKRIALRAPWRWLTPYVRGFEKYAFSAAGDSITPPFPNLVIASGRRSLPASFYIKQASPQTVVVQLQDPHCSPHLFDMVVVPEHDHVRGPNVVTTVGALNRVTPDAISAAAQQWRPRFAHLPGPYATLLLGGKSMAYDFTDADMQRIISQLQTTMQTFSGSLLVTPSRRTNPRHIAMLLAALPEGRAFVWDNIGDNPYFAMLGLANHIIVTADSVSMISEAAVTGKPIHLVGLSGGTAKFNRFYEGLAIRGITRPFAGTLDEWGYEPIYETERIAQLITSQFGGQ
jgi:mitochondrial fission protein ELM1